MRISVAKNFSEFPAGRFNTDGPYPGQKFRDEVLAPALRLPQTVTVDLDGTAGYGSSFLEEAFGGLVRVHGFSEADLRDRLTVECSSDRTLVTEVWGYIADAAE